MKIIAVICCIAFLLAGCTAADKQASDTGPTDDTHESVNNESETKAVSDPFKEEVVENESTAVIEPAQLVSKEEAQELTGVELKDGEYSEQQVVGLKICFYDSADESSMAFFQVSLTQEAFIPEGYSQTPTSIFEETKEIFGDSARVVEGIGDDAFIATPGLHILADGYYILISGGNTDDEAVIDMIKRGGELAVSNLEQILAQ